MVMKWHTQKGRGKRLGTFSTKNMHRSIASGIMPFRHRPKAMSLHELQSRSVNQRKAPITLAHVSILDKSEGE